MSDRSCPRSFVSQTVVTSVVIALLVSPTNSTASAAPPTNNTSADSLPPDLPLPAAPSSQEKWLREANILQPYGHSAFVALTDIKDRPARLKTEFGFNAVIVQPPDSHNTIASAADKLTEKQFADGIAAYRAAGYRIMLYTSVMALGLSPEFQSGQVFREHPDWLQRDPKGNPVLAWGVPWLCPSTGARDVALDRCLRIAREYNADGIMLDNNEFFFASAGWTCHCDACTKAFREYVLKRFGDNKSKLLFGAETNKLQIPTDEGPLYFEWIHWRNRVWAEVNESFRARLRQQNPAVMFFANTQYEFENGMLGTDQQYAREDVVLSESCNLSSRQASAKMILGNTLAEGRPLWNYIGTFSKPDDYTGLRSPEVVAAAIAVTLAHNARPWIVDGFDEGPTDAKSRKVMSMLLSWHAGHERLFAGEPDSAVATIISTTSRNVRHTPLIPPHMPDLQSAGASVIGLCDNELTPEKLRPFRVITAETAACLPPESATNLAAWVREGGKLIGAPDTGSYDELGRKRTASPLWLSLELSGPPTEERSVGRGHVVAPDANQFATTAIRLAQPHLFFKSPGSGAEVLAYRTPTALLLHIICHEKILTPITLPLHRDFAPNIRAQLHIAGSDKTIPLGLSANPTGSSLTIPSIPLPLYCVVEIPLQ